MKYIKNQMMLAVIAEQNAFPKTLAIRLCCIRKFGEQALTSSRELALYWGKEDLDVHMYSTSAKV